MLCMLKMGFIQSHRWQFCWIGHTLVLPFSEYAIIAPLKTKTNENDHMHAKGHLRYIIENNLSIDFKECQLDSNIFNVDRLFVIQMFCPDARGNSTMHIYTFPYQNVYSKLIYSKCISRNDFWLIYCYIYNIHAVPALIRLFFARINRHSIVYRL